jgi:hypothetical protein
VIDPTSFSDAGLCVYAKFWLGYCGPLLFWVDNPFWLLLTATPHAVETCCGTSWFPVGLCCNTVAFGIFAVCCYLIYDVGLIGGSLGFCVQSVLIFCNEGLM